MGPSDYEYREKPKRRKRKTVGRFWKPTRLAKNSPDFGLWCRECRTFRAWRDLDISYEVRSYLLYRQWWCCFCNNLVGEEALYGTRGPLQGADP